MIVKIYTTPTCIYCRTLKEYLKDHDIEFQEIDVFENEEGLQEMIKKSGQTGVPVVEIDNEIVVGFDKEKIDKLLNIQEQ